MRDNSHPELQAVIDAACSGVTVLSGNSRAMRFLLAACDRRLGAGAAAWKTPDILPLSAWIARTFREAQLAGATDLALLNGRQAQSVWRQCIEKSPGLTELLRPTSASLAAADAWKLARTYRIPLNSAIETTAQGRAFVNWVRRYQSLLDKNRWADDATVADELIRAIRARKVALPAQIHLWECGRFTPQQQELLDSLREHGTTVTEHQLNPVSANSVRWMAFDDEKTELHRAAEFSRTTLLADSSTRIGIILPGLAAERSKVQSTFTRVLQPESLLGVASGPSFELSVGEPLASSPLIRLALLLLQFSSDGLTFEELRGLIMSPWLVGAAEESEARARLCRFIAGHVPERLTLSRLQYALSRDTYREREQIELASIDVPVLRRSLGRMAKKDSGPARLPMSEWVQRLGKWLTDVGWTIDTERALDSHTFQAYEKWMQLLSEIASLDVTQGPVQRADAIREIWVAATAQTFADESTSAPIQIMDPREAVGSVFDVLWLCGMTDEAWPPRTTPDAFIPLLAQRAAGVPGSTPESVAEESRAAFEKLVESAGRVVMSHARREGDRELRRSPLLNPAQEITFDSLCVAPVDSWLDLAPAASEEFADANAPAVSSEEKIRGGTRLLELQSSCPFRAFAEFRLGASDSDEPKAGLDPRVRGEVIEYVLELFWTEARTRRYCANLEETRRRELIESSVRNAMDAKLPAPQDQAEKKLRELERTRLIQLITSWIELELARSDFDRIEHQQKFKYKVAGVELGGTIDRIDRDVALDAYVVVDYKSTDSNYYNRNKWKSPRPELPQLPLYAAYLRQQGRNIVGVAFAKLSVSTPGWSEIGGSPEIFGKKRSSPPKWAKPDLHEQIDEWSAEIERLITSYLAGDAQVDPKTREKSCAFCHLPPLCRIAEYDASEVEIEEADDEQ